MNGMLVGLGALLLASGFLIAAGGSIAPSRTVLILLAGCALALSAIAFTVAAIRRQESLSVPVDAAS